MAFLFAFNTHLTADHKTFGLTLNKFPCMLSDFPVSVSFYLRPGPPTQTSQFFLYLDLLCNHGITLTIHILFCIENFQMCVIRHWIVGIFIHVHLLELLFIEILRKVKFRWLNMWLVALKWLNMLMNFISCVIFQSMRLICVLAPSFW